MKFLLVTLTISLLLIVNIPALAEDTPIAECTKNTDGVFLKIKTSQSNQLLPLRDKDVCNFNIEVSHQFTTDGLDGIVVGSSESGLNAQEAIFIAKKVNPKFSLIGYLPVASDKISQGKYRFKDQQGGSIFFTDYTVSSQGIATSKNVYELVIDGNYCSINSNIIPTTETSKCSKPITPTFDKPLCFIHNKNKMRQVSNKRCLKINSSS